MISNLRGSLALGLVLLLVAVALFAAGHAAAVLVDPDDVELEGGGPGGSLWDVDNDDFSCFTDNVEGLAIDDAELDPDDVTDIGIQEDAFDDALMVVVDGVEYVDSDSSADLTSDASGDTLDTGPEGMLAGDEETLNVTVQYKALSSEAKLRTFVAFENPGEGDISAAISWESNLGSDSSTGVRGSSSDDTAFTTADRWLVTSDDSEEPSDPVNTFVLFGPGSPEVTPSSVDLPPEDDCLTVEYDITVPAGQTRYLLFFNQMSQTNEDALADAPVQFDTNPALGSDLVSGLSQDQLLLVLNWDFVAALGVVQQPTPTPTPTATPTATPSPSPTAVLEAQQLPRTGGTPSDGGSLPWLAIAAGVIAITSGGLALAYRTRRIR